MIVPLLVCILLAIIFPGLARAVFIALLLGVLCLSGAMIQAAHASDKIGYGSRVGMDLRIVSTVGLNSDDAVIRAVHDRGDALIFCRDYENDPSSRCINRELKSPASFTYRANCETGVFQTPGGRYRFVGPAKTDPSNLLISYQVIDLSTGEDLNGDEASGYPLAMEIFKDLCPSKAPGEMFTN